MHEIEFLESVFFGLLQGLTEFLPVSSSGHLAVFDKLFHYAPEGGFLFRVVAVHLATLIAVVVVFRREILSLFTTSRSVLLLIILGTIPAGVFGYLSRDFFEHASCNMVLVGLGFLTSAFFLILGGKHASGRKDLRDLSARDAIAVGFAQALAIIPGVSRSGLTISMGQYRGAAGRSAASFSFLLMIPAVGGAALLDAKDMVACGLEVPLGPVAVSFVAALVCGIIALKLLLRLLRRGNFSYFAYYLVPLGVVTIFWGLFF